MRPSTHERSLPAAWHRHCIWNQRASSAPETEGHFPVSLKHLKGSHNPPEHHAPRSEAQRTSAADRHAQRPRRAYHQQTPSPRDPSPPLLTPPRPCHVRTARPEHPPPDTQPSLATRSNLAGKPHRSSALLRRQPGARSWRSTHTANAKTEEPAQPGASLSRAAALRRRQCREASIAPPLLERRGFATLRGDRGHGSAEAAARATA